jgi:hypothetical protein
MSEPRIDPVALRQMLDEMQRTENGNRAARVFGFYEARLRSVWDEVYEAGRLYGREEATAKWCNVLSALLAAAATRDAAPDLVCVTCGTALCDCKQPTYRQRASPADDGGARP